LASFLVILKNDHPAASNRHIPRNVIFPVFSDFPKNPLFMPTPKNHHIKNNYYL
jgi:hypothetical protein